MSEERGVEAGMVPASLLGATVARVCHDLAGLLGTLSGSLESAIEDPEDAADALALARQASAEAAARLRLLRAAWAGCDWPLDMSAIEALAAGLPQRARLRLDLAGLGAVTLEAEQVSLLLALLLLAAEALPLGGEIAVVRDQAQEWLVRVEGARAAWPAGLTHALAEGPDAVVSARALAAPMALRAAAAAGMRLSLLMGAPEATPMLLAVPI